MEETREPKVGASVDSRGRDGIMGTSLYDGLGVLEMYTGRDPWQTAFKADRCHLLSDRQQGISVGGVRCKPHSDIHLDGREPSDDLTNPFFGEQTNSKHEAQRYPEPP